MFSWSKLDPEGVSGVGRYAARGCLRSVRPSLSSLLESSELTS